MESVDCIPGSLTSAGCCEWVWRARRRGGGFSGGMRSVDCELRSRVPDIVVTE